MMEENKKEENKKEELKWKQVRKTLLLKVNDEIKKISDSKPALLINSKSIEELEKVYNRSNILLSEKGTIFFTTFWLIGSWGFSLYVNNLSTYNIVFGTIGAFFILMIWLYYTSILLLIGGEINSKVYNRLENKSKEIQEELEQLRKETFNR